MREKIIGILGGMGVGVTAELLHRIIDLIGAKTEQDNFHIIINHNPKIPDRTRAILYGGESPLPLLKSSLQALIKTGVDFIAIPCNTVHYYYDVIQRDVPIPIIHMIKEVVEKTLLVKRELKVAGLLATTGTVRVGLYQNEFVKKHVKVILPEENEQNIVMHSIMEIKSRVNSNKVKGQIIEIAGKLIDRQAEVIIIGCTDISLVVNDGDLNVPMVDSLQVLTEKTVSMASK